MLEKLTVLNVIKEKVQSNSNVLEVEIGAEVPDIIDWWN